MVKKIENRPIVIFIILTLTILYSSQASTITQKNSFDIIVYIFLVILALIKKIKLDNFIFFILVFWTFTNILYFLAHQILEFNFFTFIGVLMKITLPYLMLKIIGPRFLEYLVKYIYVLSIISLFFFAFDIFFPGISNSLGSVLDIITQDEQREFGGWYIFIYMHSGWGDLGNLPRNSGFMWEPGAFAMMLIFSIVFRFLNNGFKFDKYIIVFIICIITTFSTAGYLALSLILLGYIMYNSKNNLVLILVLIPIVFYFGSILFEVDFMYGKIDTYYNNFDEVYEHKSGIIRVNRLGIFIYRLEEMMSWPFGNGIYESEYLIKKYGSLYVGPNAFAGVIRLYGFFGLFFLIFHIARFIKSFKLQSPLILSLFFLAISIVFFSNPIETSPLIYLIIYFSLLFHKKLYSFFTNNRPQLTEPVKN